MSGHIGVPTSDNDSLTDLGRVGEDGKGNLDSYGGDFHSALFQFNNKFKAKTKIPFKDRQAPSRAGTSCFLFPLIYLAPIHILSVLMKRTAVQTQ